MVFVKAGMFQYLTGLTLRIFMKVAALDAYILNPGNLSWDGIKALGDTTLYEYTQAENRERFEMMYRPSAASSLFIC